MTNSRIFLRHDQRFYQKYGNEKVTIVAPEWLDEGLKILSKYIPAGSKFSIYDGSSRGQPVGELIIRQQLGLKDLIQIARNEPLNVSGEIDFRNYHMPLLQDIEFKSVIYAIKDLVRQCVIVGLDETTHYGQRIPSEQKDSVYVIDLAGLQFQQAYNSGRLVLIGKHLPVGLLDKLIFQQVVGEERKATLEEVIGDSTGRYVQQGPGLFFDTIAYRKFVEYDVVLSGLALQLMAEREVNFKFLKYGTGFFAAQFSEILERNIYDGVANGLNRLFTHLNSCNCNCMIKHVELPFYNHNDNIKNVCQKHKIECRFSRDDALKRTHPLYITGTTNCADPHAMTGNEMNYASVDATIGENLSSKGNIFSPLLNPLIQERFVPIANPTTSAPS